MKRRDVLAVFNRGRISRLSLARADISRIALSAAVQINWMPRTMGPMSLRPGTAWIGNSASNAQASLIPFVFSAGDTAIIELTASALRVWDDGDALVTRPAVGAAVSNGTFDSDLTGWTDADEGGAASAWATGGFLSLTGTGYAAAIRRQSVAVTSGQEATQHALRIVVARGPVRLRVGSTAGDDDIFGQATLGTGTHSIAFTPGGSAFVVEFSATVSYPALVDSVAVEAAGVMALPTPWTSAALCRLVRWQQVNDVVFCACDGAQQQRIERRANGSWSIVNYEPADGPFLVENVSTARLTPSALRGAITLTASQRIFRAGDVGALYRVTSQGQVVIGSFSDDDEFTNDIRVTGVGATRTITIDIQGTFVGTLRLQRSVGETGSWATVASYTAAGVSSYNDALDNTVAFYRIGFGADPDHSSGTANVSLQYLSGSITGVARVTGYTSQTEVSAVVLRDFGNTTASEIWAQGAWSPRNGWPTAVTLYEGRLWWAGRSRIWGSISDALDSFDPDFEGDAGAINRYIGDGPVDVINWLMPLQRMIAGADAAEHSIRSTSFDEPITPTNYNVKEASTQGSARMPAARADGRGYFAQRSGLRLYELFFDAQRSDYATLDLTALVPEIGGSGFTRIAVQRQPDTRVWVARSDGTVAVLVRDPAEDVLGWVDVETDGAIEDICVLPGDFEDRVFWSAARTVGAGTVRFHEEMARQDQCAGGALSRLADAHVVYQGAAATSVSGLSHLNGESLVVWADGRDVGPLTVASGAITLPTAATNVCAGLGYRARYQSAKLAAETAIGLSLTQRSRIDHLGLILADTHAQGLRYGPSFETMDDLPMVEHGADVAGDAVWDAYAADMVAFPGEWGTDNRLCLEANAPRPATVMAAVLSVDRQEKA